MHVIHHPSWNIYTKTATRYWTGAHSSIRSSRCSMDMPSARLLASISDSDLQFGWCPLQILPRFFFYPLTYFSQSVRLLSHSKTARGFAFPDLIGISFKVALQNCYRLIWFSLADCVCVHSGFYQLFHWNILRKATLSSTIGFLQKIWRNYLATLHKFPLMYASTIFFIIEYIFYLSGLLCT
jgi:hypothetical protein